MKDWNAIRNTGCFRGKPRLRLVNGKWLVFHGLDGNHELIDEAFRFAERVNGNVEHSGKMGCAMTPMEKLCWENGQVVDFQVSEDRRTLAVTEACDSVFSVELVKDEVVELAGALMALAETMEGCERMVKG